MTDIETAVPTSAPPRQITKAKSVTMEYFLETSHLDSATSELLQKYNKGGDGSFSKDEVVEIILDLREALKNNESLYYSNKLFRRLLVGATVFCILLLVAMFGMSYAVAALTANTDVTSDGTLLAKGTTMTIATDSRFSLHVPVELSTGVECFSALESEQMLAEAMAGKNIAVRQYNATTGHESMVQLDIDGMEFHEETGGACWTDSAGQEVCLIPNEDCVASSEEERRRLHSYDEAYLAAGGQDHRALGKKGNSAGGSGGSSFGSKDKKGW